MKTTQKEKVIKQLKENGEVSRNWCLQNYISRLSAIIQDLEQDGWKFETIRRGGNYKTEADYIYKVTKSKYKKVEYYVPMLQKTIIKYERA